MPCPLCIPRHSSPLRNSEARTLMAGLSVSCVHKITHILFSVCHEKTVATTCLLFPVKERAYYIDQNDCITKKMKQTIKILSHTSTKVCLRFYTYKMSNSPVNFQLTVSQRGLKLTIIDLTYQFKCRIVHSFVNFGQIRWKTSKKFARLFAPTLCFCRQRLPLSRHSLMPYIRDFISVGH